MTKASVLGFLSTPSARRATKAGVLNGCETLFLSTPSARRATGSQRPRCYPCQISIHALREGGDTSAARDMGDSMISIHALREEGDKNHLILSGIPTKFLSTPSARRATWFSEGDGCESENFYPRPPRGGRHGTTHEFAQRFDISIHALREEGDRFDA